MNVLWYDIQAISLVSELPKGYNGELGFLSGPVHSNDFVNRNKIEATCFIA